jgi:4-hydroxy-3-polyprenylbenzoate decarboxylase
MYPDLQTFVAALEAAGELKRIKARVSPVLEIAQWADAESKAAAPNAPSRATRDIDPRFHSRGGHALLFENVEGSNIPVLINALGSYRRIEMALGCHDEGRTVGGVVGGGGLEALAARIAELAKPAPPRSFEEIIDAAKRFLPLVKIPPKRRSGRGPSQEVVNTANAIDLTRIPMLRCWPHDGDYAAVGYPANINAGVPGAASGPEWESNFRGRYITLAGIHTIYADDIDDEKPASRTTSACTACSCSGPRTLAMHWHMHHDGARHWRSWKAWASPCPSRSPWAASPCSPTPPPRPLPPGSASSCSRAS